MIYFFLYLFIILVAAHFIVYSFGIGLYDRLCSKALEEKSSVKRSGEIKRCLYSVNSKKIGVEDAEELKRIKLLFFIRNSSFFLCFGTGFYLFILYTT